VRAEEAAPPVYTPLVLSTNDRLLVLAPHPDDEVIGCGGVIQRAAALGIPVNVAFFTYGDNNEWSFMVYRKHAVIIPSAVRQMGLVRHDEAVSADASLGLRRSALAFLGYPDFGTFGIWTQHWGENPPFASMLTRVTKVPYSNAFRPGAAYKGEEIVKDLTSLLRSFRPTRVFVSHPADFNPDHRALYLFTRIALWDLEAEIKPQVHAYLVHFPNWPKPKGRHADLALDAPDFLARQTEWQAFDLTPAEADRKDVALSFHATQFKYSSRYLLSFIRKREIFGDLPAVVFSEAAALEDLSSGQSGSRNGTGSEDLLTEEEKAQFVGVECRKVNVDAEAVTVAIELSRPLGEAVAAKVSVFGYRRDIPFGEMPKIQVQIGHVEETVLDRLRPLPRSNVSLERAAREIKVRVPLTLLGSPERLLVSARTQLGEVPLDWASWRIIEIVRKNAFGEAK